MIRYDRLWATMEARGMTQYRLIKQYSFSAGQIGRLKKNMHVSTHTLDTLCSILECDISDIIEYVPDELPQPEEVPAGQSADTPDDRDQAEGPGQEGDYGQGEDSGQEDTPPAKQKRSDAAMGDKPDKRLSRVECERKIAELTREMKEAAKILEFEHAAFLRDRIEKLRKQAERKTKL